MRRPVAFRSPVPAQNPTQNELRPFTKRIGEQDDVSELDPPHSRLHFRKLVATPPDALSELGLSDVVIAPGCRKNGRDRRAPSMALRV
jgi:hypothetical protein